MEIRLSMTIYYLWKCFILSMFAVILSSFIALSLAKTLINSFWLIRSLIFFSMFFFICCLFFFLISIFYIVIFSFFQSIYFFYSYILYRIFLLFQVFFQINFFVFIIIQYYCFENLIAGFSVRIITNLSYNAEQVLLLLLLPLLLLDATELNST